MTKISCLVRLGEIIAVYSRNHIEPVNTVCGNSAYLSNVKVDGIYSNHYVLKC
jgi:hypothetical protein